MIVLDLVEPPAQPKVELWGAVLCRAIEDLAGGYYCPAEGRVRISAGR